MTDDEMEALNLKYSNEVRLVLVLSSGRIALFGNDRKLARICETWEEVASAYGAVTVARYEEPSRISPIKFSLEDLGL